MLKRSRMRYNDFIMSCMKITLLLYTIESFKHNLFEIFSKRDRKTTQTNYLQFH